MIGFTVKRDPAGRPLVLVRIRDGRPEQWTVDGWQPTGVESSGIGGATEWDAITPEEAVDVLRQFGASDLNPVL